MLLSIFHIFREVKYPNVFLTKSFFIKEIMHAMHSFGPNWIHIVSKGP
jgi:hypothetical protein